MVDLGKFVDSDSLKRELYKIVDEIDLAKYVDFDALVGQLVEMLEAKVVNEPNVMRNRKKKAKKRTPPDVPAERGNHKGRS